MSHLFLDLHLFYFLRLKAFSYELANLMKGWPQTIINMPKIKKEQALEEDSIELSDVLATVLASMSNATGQLRNIGMALSLGKNPLSMQLTGELISVAVGGESILVNVQPTSKEKKNG